MSWHSGRILINDFDLSSNEALIAFLKGLRVEMKRAVQSVLHAKIDYIVMGMSAQSFWSGTEGAREFPHFMGGLSGGLGITAGADVCAQVMQLYGAKRIGIITPY